MVNIEKPHVIIFILLFMLLTNILFSPKVEFDIVGIEFVDLTLASKDIELYYGVDNTKSFSVDDIKSVRVQCDVKNKSLYKLFDVWVYFDDNNSLSDIICGNSLDTLDVAPYIIAPSAGRRIDFSFLVDGKKFDNTEDLLNKLKEVKIYVGLRKNDRKISESKNLNITQWQDEK